MPGIQLQQQQSQRTPLRSGDEGFQSKQAGISEISWMKGAYWFGVDQALGLMVCLACEITQCVIKTLTFSID